MHPIDWLIPGVLIIVLLGVLVYCQRFIRNSADFLAASRCAGRYVLCISSGIAGFAVVNSVANFELFYQAGFSGTWWGMLSAPVGLILALTAWVTYRLRETRCFTLAQFYEVRYSRKFRICAGIITFLSGVVNYGIFPAVSVRFFMFFCRIPEHVQLWGVNWDTYGVLLTFAIGLGVLFATCGGQIAIMVTDFLQGTLCNIAFLAFILFIFNLGDWDIFGGYVSWEQISYALQQAPSEASQINPFHTSEISDFNIWYFLIGIFGMIYARGGWQGGMGYQAAAKTPHESKMAGILGSWRGIAQGLMIMLFPLAVIVIMRHPDFAGLAEQINHVLDNTTDPQLRSQGLVPTALSMILPTGLLGLLVAVMFAAMLSTDDTYMHSWGSIFIQDVLMPFRKKPFSPKAHLWALRASIFGVALFAWFFSYFYRQTEHVFMFFAVTGAIVSGAGAAIIGGLYWKRGGTIAAWTTYIVGALIGFGGITIQQTWPKVAVFLDSNFHWHWVARHMTKFPINGQWITFIGLSICLVCYVAVSLYEHYALKAPDFDLNKMLHRGEYDTSHEHKKVSKVGLLAQRLGITPEFSRGDKIIYGATIAWTLFWLGIFVWFSLQQFISGVPDSQWLGLWQVKIYITVILAVVTTVWFLVGGVVDVTRLFRDLRKIQQNDADDGTVVNGHNAGDPPSPGQS